VPTRPGGTADRDGLPAALIDGHGQTHARRRQGFRARECRRVPPGAPRRPVRRRRQGV